MLGFSGGADSLCLLSLLVELGRDVTAAHFDHRLRPESGKDAGEAEKIAASLGVPFVRGVGGAYQASQGLGVEAAAREQRYEFLFSQARKLKAAALLTAHTANDQAETLLLNLLRGAGTRGLAGMRLRRVLPGFDKQIPLVRPMLGFTREETEGWCLKKNLTPVIDPSNRSPVYLRNRLRHEVLPLLKELNPAVVQVLARNAQSLANDASVLDEVLADDLAGLIVSADLKRTILDLNRLDDLSEARQGMVIRHTLTNLLPTEATVSFEMVEQVRELLRGQRRARQLQLGGKLKAELRAGRLILGGRLDPNEFPCLQGDVSISGERRILLGEKWDLRVVKAIAPAEFPSDDWQCWTHVEDEAELVLRRSRPGDRVELLGDIQASQKLGDAFTNAKIPREARQNWPVLERDGKILWVPGVRRSRHGLTKPGAACWHLRVRRADG